MCGISQSTEVCVISYIGAPGYTGLLGFIGPALLSGEEGTQIDGRTSTCEVFCSPKLAVSEFSMARASRLVLSASVGTCGGESKKLKTSSVINVKSSRSSVVRSSELCHPDRWGAGISFSFSVLARCGVSIGIGRSAAWGNAVAWRREYSSELVTRMRLCGARTGDE